MAGDLVYGWEQVGWVVPETVYGTLVYPVASNAILFTKLGLTPDPESRKIRQDLRDTRSARSQIRGKRKASWSYEGYLRPSGVAGTAPDEGELLKQAFGIETIVGATSVTYVFSKNPELVNPGLSIHRIGGHFGEAVRGAIIETLSIKVEGNGEAMLEASGPAADHLQTGTTDLAVQATGGASSITITTGDRYKYMPGSKVDVGTSTAHVITGPVDAYGYLTSDVVTVTPNISGTQAIGSDVIPHQPVITVGGAPIAGVFGSITLNAVTFQIVSVAFTVQTKYQLRENQYAQVTPNKYLSPAQREVTVEVEVYVTKDQYRYVGHGKQEVVNDAQIVIGSGVGTRATINMDRVLFSVPPIEVPEDNETTMTLSGIAVSDGSAENEATVVFD